MKQRMTRRKLVKAAALAGVFPSIVIGSAKALANTSQLDPENGQAKALAYSNQSAMAGQNSGNCQLYTGDTSKDWGPCAIFPGTNVATAGWCKAWVAKG